MRFSGDVAFVLEGSQTGAHDAFLPKRGPCVIHRGAENALGHEVRFGLETCLVDVAFQGLRGGIVRSMFCVSTMGKRDKSALP